MLKVPIGPNRLPRGSRLRSRKTLIHFATGGLGHFLTRLGRSIDFSQDAGWDLGVVTEYHQPLGKLSFHEVFLSSPPIRRWSELEVNSRRFNIETLRPDVEYRRGNGAIVTIRDVVDHRVFPAQLPPKMVGHNLAFTTGDPEPGLSKFRRNAGWLTAISSLSLVADFSEAVVDRLTRLQAPYIGVHFRNSDRLGDFNGTIQTLRQRIGETQINDVWWCTDDASSVGAAIDAIPSARFYSSQTFSLGNRVNLHNGLRGDDSINHLKNTFADLLTLCAADEYIPASRSGWNSLVPLMREAKDSSARFFGLTTP